MSLGETRFLGVSVVILLVLLTYSNSVWNGFVYDDWDLVVGKQQYETSRGLLYPFVGALKWGAFRPLRDVSHAVDRLLWKEDPMGHHITSIVFHVLSSVIVFLIGLRILGASFPAVLMGILFGVHPVLTESVSWISGRRDILCGLFFFLGLLMFIEYWKSRRRQYLFWLILCYVLTFSSKEMGVSLPLVLALYDYIFIWRASGGVRERARYIYILLLVLAIGFSLLTLEVSTGQKRGEFHGGSRYLTLLTMFKVVSGYIRLLIYPVGMCAEHDVRIAATMTEPVVLVSTVIVMSILVLGFERLRKDKLIGFGILWFFLTLIPVSNVIVPIGNIMADRYLYIPSAGFCIVVSVLVCRIRANWVKVLTGFILVSFYMFLTINRNKDWKDDFTLWTKTAEQVPCSAKAHYQLGKAYSDCRNYDTALMHLERSVAIAPRQALSHSMLGHVYLQKGLIEQAKKSFETALKLDQFLATAHLNLGVVYVLEGRNKDAILEMRKAVMLEPDESFFHYDLAATYAQGGKLREALYHYGEAVRLNPGDLKALNNLGVIYMAIGMFDEAEITWRKALELNPGFVEASRNLEVLERKRSGGTGSN